MNRNSKVLLWLALSCCQLTGKSAMGSDDASKILQDQLKAKAEEAAKRMPPEKQKIMNDAIEALRNEKILEKVPKVGETFPEFSLLDVKGRAVKRSDIIVKRRTIITFYRGGWCPYCSIQLHAFQKELPKIRSLDAELIAVSPELSDNSLSTQEKNKLQFTVLSDPDQMLARKLGIVYSLPESLKTLYSQLKIDLPAVNGQQKWELPLAATFVVDRTGKILYAFAHEDYKVRAPMGDILKALE